MLKQNPLIQFAGVPVSGAELRSCFADLSSPVKNELTRSRGAGRLRHLKREQGGM